MSHLGRRLSAWIDGELDAAERDRVLIHLARCEPCRGEAAALRTLKRRMSALGEAAADSALTRRLMGLAQSGSPLRPGPAWPPGGSALAPRFPGRPGREIRPAWYVALGCSAVFLTSVGTAAFMAGGSGQPAPRVTPQVDVFMSQYDVTTGMVPVLQPQRAQRAERNAVPHAP